jgi:hypothetical protein
MVDPRGAAVGDYDDDGDLDIYITDKKGNNALLRNEINNSNWIKVEIPVDHVGAIGGLGVKVYLRKDGKLIGYREIIPAQGYLGTDSSEVVFGLKSPAGTYEVWARFANNVVRKVKDVRARQRVKIPYGYILKIECGNNGMTNPCTGIHVCEKLKEVVVEAIPYSGYAFDYWDGDIYSKDNPVKVVMDSNKVIRANFKSISPPINFTAARDVNKTLLYREHINRLTWERNPENEGINIIGYRLFQLQGESYQLYDNEAFPPILLGEVNADKFEYLHRHVDLKKEYRYAIVAIGEDGRESSATYTTVGTSKIVREEYKEKTQNIRR